MQLNPTEIKARNTAIARFVEDSIIPIIFETAPSPAEKVAGTYATGTLFRFDDKSFLITASHVLDGHEKLGVGLGIPIGKRSSRLFNLNGSRFFVPSDATERRKFDVGVVVLEERVAAELANSYRLLGYENVGRFRYDRMLYICGFPKNFTKYDRDTDHIEGRPFRFMSWPRQPDATDYEHFDRTAHILIQYGDVYYEHGINPDAVVARQDLEGISGWLVWNYYDNPGGVWAAEKCLQVVGIQSTMIKGRWLKAVQWSAVASVFKSIDAAIHTKLIERLTH